MLRSLARLFAPRETTRRHRRPRPRLEALEERWVPATLQVVDGLLTYTAATGVANNLSVSLSGTSYTFRDTAETISVVGIPGATGSGTNTVTLPGAQVPSAGMLLDLGDKNDVLTIESAAHAIAVMGGADNDTVNVGQLSGGDLSAISGAVTVDGELGIDTVRVNDQANPLGTSYYTVGATTVTRTGSSLGFALSYAGAENLTVNTGSSSDLITIPATLAGTRTTINAGAGADRFNVGNTANTLDDVKGLLLLNGGTQPTGEEDVVYFYDQGTAAGLSYTLRADNYVARTGSALISYS